MLKFYYHPLSPISRRVWLALLEKEIPFESVMVNPKNGDNKQPEFLALNPFHHIPVITDGDLRLIESLAILDYLDGKYPTPRLTPATIEEQARMKMIQMVTVNELMTKTPAVINASNVPLSNDLVTHIETTLRFLSDQLSGDAIARPYFGGETINLADITVGAVLPLMHRLGLALDSYPRLQHWHQQITARPAWVETSPSDVALELWRSWLERQIQVMRKRQARQYRQTTQPDSLECAVCIGE